MNKLNITIKSELYVAGRTEDGSEYSAESYYIEAENAKGARWVAPIYWLGCDVVEDEDYTAFVDVREEAMAKAEAYLASLGEVNLEDWAEVAPAYGSSAYQSGGYESTLDGEES